MPQRSGRLYLRFISGQIPNLLQVITSVTILNYLHKNPYLTFLFAIVIPLSLIAYLNTAFEHFLQETDPQEIQRKHYVYQAITVTILALIIMSISATFVFGNAGS